MKTGMSSWISSTTEKSVTNSSIRNSNYLKDKMKRKKKPENKKVKDKNLSNGENLMNKSTYSKIFRTQTLSYLY